MGTRLRLWLDEHQLAYEQVVIGVVAGGRGEPRVYHSFHTALHFRPVVGGQAA